MHIRRLGAFLQHNHTQASTMGDGHALSAHMLYTVCSHRKYVHKKECLLIDAVIQNKAREQIGTNVRVCALNVGRLVRSHFAFGRSWNWALNQGF
jgi:hypothetical protein